MWTQPSLEAPPPTPLMSEPRSMSCSRQLRMFVAKPSQPLTSPTPRVG
jgi:hypothetical protein